MESSQSGFRKVVGEGVDISNLSFESVSGYNEKFVFGCGLRGYIEISYADLIFKLGAPKGAIGTDGKVRVCWRLKYSDGVVLTIYDYRSSAPVHSLTEWHIGGRVGDKVLERVSLLFPGCNLKDGRGRDLLNCSLSCQEA